MLGHFRKLKAATKMSTSTMQAEHSSKDDRSKLTLPGCPACHLQSSWALMGLIFWVLCTAAGSCPARVGHYRYRIAGARPRGKTLSRSEGSHKHFPGKGGSVAVYRAYMFSRLDFQCTRDLAWLRKAQGLGARTQRRRHAMLFQDSACIHLHQAKLDHSPSVPFPDRTAQA